MFSGALQIPLGWHVLRWLAFAGLLLGFSRCGPSPAYGQPIRITNSPIERALSLSNVVNVANTNFANMWRDFTNYSLYGLNTNLALAAERVMVTAADKRTTNALASIDEVNRLVGLSTNAQTALELIGTRLAGLVQWDSPTGSVEAPLMAFDPGTGRGTFYNPPDFRALAKVPTYVATIADMVNATVPSGNQARVVTVGGRSTENDGGGGTFYFDPASTAETNRGRVFKPAGADGRYIRIAQAGIVTLEEFEGFPNGTDTTTAFNYAQAAAGGGGVIQICAGTYLGNWVVTQQNLTIRGIGGANFIHAGQVASSYLAPYDTNAPALTIGADLGYVQNPKVQDLSIRGRSINGDIGLRVAGGTYHAVFDRLALSRFKNPIVAESGTNYPTQYLYFNDLDVEGTSDNNSTLMHFVSPTWTASRWLTAIFVNGARLATPTGTNGFICVQEGVPSTWHNIYTDGLQTNTFKGVAVAGADNPTFHFTGQSSIDGYGVRNVIVHAWTNDVRWLGKYLTTDMPLSVTNFVRLSDGSDVQMPGGAIRPPYGEHAYPRLLGTVVYANPANAPDRASDGTGNTYHFINADGGFGFINRIGGHTMTLSNAFTLVSTNGIIKFGAPGSGLVELTHASSLVMTNAQGLYWYDRSGTLIKVIGVDSGLLTFIAPSNSNFVLKEPSATGRFYAANGTNLIASWRTNGWAFDSIGSGKLLGTTTDGLLSPISTVAGLESLLADNLLAGSEVDSSAELRGLLGDETGGGVAMFNDGPTITNALTLRGPSSVVNLDNGVIIQVKDSGGTYRTFLTVDSSDLASFISRKQMNLVAGAASGSSEGRLYADNGNTLALTWGTNGIALNTLAKGPIALDANKWIRNVPWGVATLVGGTVTVTNSAVTANSRIFLTTQTPGGTVGAPYISARSAGSTFTISSTSGTDTSTVAWMLQEP